jgi:ferredoxin-like protein FixX
MTLTRGRFPGKRIPTGDDAAIPRRAAPPPPPFTPDGRLTFSKADAVGRADNTTRDDIPSHLLPGPDIPPALAALYARMCPAGVYELKEGRLVVNPPNCIDCKATDVLGPRWLPREGAAGPNYKHM